MLGLGGVSGALAYRSNSARKNAEEQLDILETTNSSLIAQGFPPENTGAAEDEVSKQRGQTIGLGAASAALLVAGGIALLVDRSRKNRSKAITLRPTVRGIEVSF